MPKSLTKPPVDDPQAIFNYGVACGVDQERERIIESLRAYAGDESLISVEVAIALINNVEEQ